MRYPSLHLWSVWTTKVVIYIFVLHGVECGHGPRRSERVPAFIFYYFRDRMSQGCWSFASSTGKRHKNSRGLRRPSYGPCFQVVRTIA